MPRGGVAERIGEAVMRGEAPEQLGRPHLVGRPAPYAGGVVEDYPLGHAADIGEDVLQGLADALGVLAGKDLGQAHVGIGERQDEIAQAPANPHHIEVRLPEIRLGLARFPCKVEKALARGAVLRAQCFDIAPDRARAHVGAALLDEPLPYPLRGVPLLAPGRRIVLYPLPDERLVGIELARALLPRGGRRGEIIPLEVFVDRVAGDAVSPRDLGDAASIASLLPYRIDGGHVDHVPFRLSDEIPEALVRLGL